MNLDLIAVIVGFAAGVVRGYAGFGGPAFILSVMTWFLTPVQVIAKVLIVELVAAAFLAWRCRKDIQWKLVLALTLPTVASLPFGHWLLMHNDADLMGKVISAAIVLSSLLMLAKVKYPRK